MFPARVSINNRDSHNSHSSPFRLWRDSFLPVNAYRFLVFHLLAGCVGSGLGARLSTTRGCGVRNLALDHGS
jgi:hypothetical protein